MTDATTSATASATTMARVAPGRPFVKARSLDLKWSLTLRVVAAALACFLVAAAGLATALIVFAMRPSEAAGSGVVKIAIFNFELNDRSAGGGVVAKDPRDTKYLQMATAKARHMLSASGRYSIVDTASDESKLIAAGGIQQCDGCEVPLARKLGADEALVGLVTRVSRTEYTIQIFIKDVRTGKTVSDVFTGLRMGANYSWPRGVEWLLKNRILSAPAQ